MKLTQKRLYILVWGIVFLCVDLIIQVSSLDLGFIHADDESLRRSFAIFFAQNYIGTNYQIDVVSDIIGYTLLLVGLYGIIKMHKRFLYAFYATIVGLTLQMVLYIIPLTQLNLFMLVDIYLLFTFIKFMAYITIVFSILRGIYAFIDNYLYLEFWKNVKTYWDIMVISAVVTQVFRFATLFSLPAGEFFTVAVYLFGVVYNLIIAYKIAMSYKYIKAEAKI